MLDGLQMGLIVTYLFIYFLTNSEMLRAKKLWLLVEYRSPFLFSQPAWDIVASTN